MIDRLFLAHPRSVGESYAEHAATAGMFGVKMVVGGMACIVHAVFPTLFERTASGTVKQLYGQMVKRQPELARKYPMADDPQWCPEYEI